MSEIVRSALVEYSARDMYLLVENIEAYPEFLPWCRSTRVLERVDGRTVATLVIGLKGIDQSFTTENLNNPGSSIDLRLIEGPFKAFRARWNFQALNDSAARIEFSISYTLSSGLLARVLGPVFDQIANTMVDAFIGRAEVVYGRSES